MLNYDTEHLTTYMGYTDDQIKVIVQLRKLAEALFQGTIGFEFYSSEVKKLLIKVGW